MVYTDVVIFYFTLINSDLGQCVIIFYEKVEVEKLAQ